MALGEGGLAAAARRDPRLAELDVQVEVLEFVIDGEMKGVPGASQQLALAVDIEGMGLAQRQGG
jgi:hypothetical protein